MPISRVYDERVTNNGPVDESGQDWQQPPFVPPDEQAAPTVSGAIVVPNSPAPPPSVAEVAIRAVAGVVWPVMLLLGIFGPMSFWAALVIAMVASAVLRQVSRELKRRRKAPYQIPSGPSEELR